MATYSDSFTNADGTALSTHNASWQKRPTAAVDFTISSNALATGTGTEKASYWNAATADDQFSEGTLAVVPPATDILTGVAVRIQALTTANWYGFWTEDGYATIHKWVAGVLTNLGSPTDGYLAGPVIRLEITGNQLTFLLDGILQTPPGTVTDASFTSGFSGVCGYGLATGVVTLDDWSGGDLGAPPADANFQKRFPDTIAASTNITGTVDVIGENPYSADGNWLTATSGTAATDLRVTFPSPGGDPTGTQNFRCLVRKTAGSAVPLLDILLYQAGASVATLVNDTMVTSTSGQVVQGNWNASQLSGALDGSDVECRLTAVAGLAPGATPAYSATGQAAAVTNATITTAILPAKPSTVNSGDLLLLHVLARNNENDGAGPATIGGWNSFPGNPYGGVNHARTSLYWRIAGAAEANQTVSVTCTGGVTADLAMARIYRITAANGFFATPIDSIASISGTLPQLAGPTVTPTGTNQLAVCIASMASNSATVGSFTGEIGGDWIERALGATTIGGDGSLDILTSDQSGGGAISLGTIPFTTTTSSHWVTIGFVVIPAGTGAATNTIEVGALEWNAQYADGASINYTLQESGSLMRVNYLDASAPFSTPDAATILGLVSSLFVVPGGPVVGQPFMKRLTGVPFMTLNEGIW